MPVTNQSLMHTTHSMHHNLNIILDQYRRAFTLKRVISDSYINENIQALRTLIEQTENPDILFSEFKKKMGEMKTWKETWRWITRSDCSLEIYTYMLPVVDGLSKNHTIKALQDENITLKQNIHVIENNHEKEIMALTKKHASEIQNHSSDKDKAEKIASSLLYEISLLKDAQLIQEARILESQQRIDALVAQNMQLLDQMQAMQELMRPGAQVHGGTPLVKEHVDAEVVRASDHHVIAMSGM